MGPDFFFGGHRESAVPRTRGNHVEDLEFLARSAETVFRKLIRFLVGRISLVKLLEMIRYIYVQEAEQMLQAQNPGKNVPLTRFALLTGLDTRTVTQVRKQLALHQGQYRQQLLAELTPETAIVEAWSSLSVDGETPELDYGAEGGEFETLVKATISTRGVTTQSIIERLEATHSIEVDRQRQRLRLLVDRYSPYLSDDEPNIVNAAFSAMSNLLGTIEHNVEAPLEEKMFQRQTWTFRLPPEDQLRFRQSMRDLLEDMNQRAERAIEPWEATRYGDDLHTAGIGLYYFEDR